MKKPFERILIVMFENQYRSYVLQDPIMQKIAAAGVSMDNYFGAFHPSQTNYIASLAGEVCGVTTDNPPVSPLLQETMVDLLEARKISWKAYMEAYPGEQWNPVWKKTSYSADDTPLTEYPSGNDADLARYYRKHNAFASFHTIQKDKDRWNKIVSEVEFWEDIQKQNLPQYSWFTPDIWNDGHYLFNTHIDTDPRTELIPQISNWLKYTFFGKLKQGDVQGGVPPGVDYVGLNLDLDLLLSDPEQAWKKSRVPSGTLIVLTFDEADFNAKGYNTNYDGPNQIYTVLLGDMIKPGTSESTPFNHYSLMRTIQKNFGLDDLGKNDATANWLRFLWNKEFAWKKAHSTAAPKANSLAAVHAGGRYIVFTQGAEGNIQEMRFHKGKWSDPTDTGIVSSGQIAVAALKEEIYLAFIGQDQQLFLTHSKGKGKWSVPSPLGIQGNQSLALASYHDTGDGGKEKMMLCWQGQDNFIRYQIFSHGKWQPAGEVGQITDGNLALGQRGPSLYLVYKDWRRYEMRMTSFNLAAFNAFQAEDFQGNPDPDNNTTQYQWSPADMAVGHFSQKFESQQDDYKSSGEFSLASIDGEMHLIYHQVYQPILNDTFFGLTGIFTAENQDTNGWGTIRQAGWTDPQPVVAEKSATPDFCFATASDGEHILLVWSVEGSGELNYKTGGYN